MCALFLNEIIHNLSQNVVLSFFENPRFFVFVCQFGIAKVNCFACLQWLRIRAFFVAVISEHIQRRSVSAEKKTHLLMAFFQSFHFVSWQIFTQNLPSGPKSNYTVALNFLNASQNAKNTSIWKISNKKYIWFKSKHLLAPMRLHMKRKVIELMLFLWTNLECPIYGDDIEYNLAWSRPKGLQQKSRNIFLSTFYSYQVSKHRSQETQEPN